MKKLLPLLCCLLFIGCGEKKETGDNGASDNGEVAGESVTAETEAPASPESRIIGYWALDFEKCRKAFEELPDSEEKEEFSKFLSIESKQGAFFHFSKGGKFGMYKYDKLPEFSTFTIITDDEGVISIDTEEAVSLELKGDTLQMIPPRSGPRGPEGSPSEWAIMGCFRLSRIDAAEAKRRMERVHIPSDNSEDATEPAEPSSDATEDNQDDSLSDADVERLLKEAVEIGSLDAEYDDFEYEYVDKVRTNKSTPYTGWVKRIEENVIVLMRIRNGRPDGPLVAHYKNGQRRSEGSFRDGSRYGIWKNYYENGQLMRESNMDGVFPDSGDGYIRFWHENGQKRSEEVFESNGLTVSRYWNSKGEEVETPEEADE